MLQKETTVEKTSWDKTQAAADAAAASDEVRVRCTIAKPGTQEPTAQHRQSRTRVPRPQLWSALPMSPFPALPPLARGYSIVILRSQALRSAQYGPVIHPSHGLAYASAPSASSPPPLVFLRAKAPGMRPRRAAVNGMLIFSLVLPSERLEENLMSSYLDRFLGIPPEAAPATPAVRRHPRRPLRRMSSPLRPGRAPSCPRRANKQQCNGSCVSEILYRANFSTARPAEPVCPNSPTAGPCHRDPRPSAACWGLRRVPVPFAAAGQRRPPEDRPPGRPTTALISQAVRWYHSIPGRTIS